MNDSKPTVDNCNTDILEALAGLLAAAKQVRNPTQIYRGIPPHYALKKLDEAILKAESVLKSVPTA